MIEPRTCPTCGATLVIRPGERQWKFARRVTCDRKCAGEARGHRMRTQQQVSDNPRWAEELIPWPAEARFVDNITFAEHPGPRLPQPETYVATMSSAA